MTSQQFIKTIRDYYKKHRRDFPWRRTKNPYHILVSEVMLQQTQTSRVIEKYEQFIEKFPTVEALAQASLRSVLIAWQGLGYNRRALMLKKAAEVLIKEYNGVIPDSVEMLDSLPGIGHTTACAIAAFAFNKPAVFIETNIRTVFLHHFFKTMRRAVHDNQIRPLVGKTLDMKNPREWYYALMDYGVMFKKTYGNPNSKSVHYSKQSRFLGSNRQVRGFILKSIAEKKKISLAQLIKTAAVQLPHFDSARFHRNLEALYKEGFLINSIKGLLRLSLK